MKAPEAQTEEQKGLYVRLPKSLKDWLRNFSGRSDTTEAAIITALVQYLKNLGEEEGAEATDLLHRLKAAHRGPYEFFDLQRWIDHAIMRKRWVWVIEYAHHLWNHIVDIPSVAQWLLYRESYAWINFGDQLRRDALSLTDKRTSEEASSRFKCARKSLERGLEILEVYLAKEQHPVVRYNKACAHAILAAVAVEESLGVDGELERNLHSKEIAEDRTRRLRKLTGPAREKYWNRQPSDRELGEYWRSVGPGWRGILKRRHSQILTLVEKEVFEHSEASIGVLEGLFQSEGPSPQVPTSRTDLLHWAESDPDLLFLKHDDRVRERYNSLQSYSEPLTTIFDRLSQLHLAGPPRNKPSGRSGARRPA